MLKLEEKLTLQKIQFQGLGTFKLCKDIARTNARCKNRLCLTIHWSFNDFS